MVILCEHGIRAHEPCTDCLQEAMQSQPAASRISKLLADSRYFSSAPWPERSIENAFRKFQIQLLRVDDRDAIDRVQDLLEETFGEEEVDPVSVLKAAIQG